MLFQYRYDSAGVTPALNFFKERSFYADDHPSKWSFTPIRLAQTFRCRVVKLDSLHDFDLQKTTFCTSFRTFLISFLRKTFIIKFLIAYYFWLKILFGVYLANFCQIEKKRTFLKPLYINLLANFCRIKKNGIFLKTLIYQPFGKFLPNRIFAPKSLFTTRIISVLRPVDL